MSLVNFAKKVREILEKGDNATLPELQKVVFKGLEKEYNNLKKRQLTIVLQHLKGKNEYNLYPHESLLMLKFKHRVESELDKKAIKEMDNAKIFMHLPDGKMIEVAEFDTFEQLIDKNGEPSYFSFEVKNIEKITTKIQAQVRGHLIRNKDPNGVCTGPKKCPAVDKRIQGKKMSNKVRESICNSYPDCKWEETEVEEEKAKDNEDELLTGDCTAKNDIGKKQCPPVDERIKGKNMSNKARKSICNSYANCKWDEATVGGRKKKRRKKKKAFPSRKKTHRKNSTKKRARK